MSASMQMKLVEDGRNINALPARPWGFGEEKRGRQTQGEGRNERKVEMLPGGPHTADIIYGEEGGEEGEENIRVGIKVVEGRKRKKKKVSQSFSVLKQPIKSVMFCVIFKHRNEANWLWARRQRTP